MLPLFRFSSCKLIASLILFTASIAIAQTDTAKIQGTITDSQGAVIPNASISATNTATGQTYTAATGSNGSYTIPSVIRGPYKAEIKAPGFQTDTESFQLNISEQKNLSVSLQAGEVSQVIDVTAEGQLLDTSSSSMGEVIQGRQVVDLPLNGRNFTQLALLTPGVTRGAYGDISSGVGNNAETFRNGSSGGAELSVNGLRPQANNFILDGVDNNEALVNGINFFPPVEATQEFKVNTAVAPAEFGRAGGGIIQTSIKSGTNQIHGSIFEFLRNSAFDASPNYFNPITNGKKTPVLPFKRNQFGGTLGGPIWKNKLFIFGDYQGLRESQPLNPEFATVPTALMRTGDFSELMNPALTAGKDLTTLPASFACATAPAKVFGAIYNPLTCQPFPGNVIPTSQQNQAAVKYLNAFPMPNTSGTIEQNYKAVRRNIRHFNDFDVRLDWVATSRDTFFGRYSYGQDSFDLTSRLVVLPSGFGSGVNANHPRGVAAGETHIFGSSLVNDFRYGYSRPFYSYLNPFNNVPLSANFGIVNANRSPQLGGGALIGGFNSEIEYTGDGGPYIVPQKANQFEDTVSYVRGSHSFRFGVNIIKRDVDYFISDFRGKGFFMIGPGTGDFTGYEVSELLAGFIDNYAVSTPVNVKTHSYENGFFGQDDWKVTPRLTLNLGLRYDIFTNPSEEHNQWSNFDLPTGTLIEAGKGGPNSSLIKTDKNNYVPRIGFAYDLFGSGKTVLRGGYGIFYFLDRGGVGNQLSANPDISANTSLSASAGARVTFSGQAPTGSNNNQIATAPLPIPVNNVNLTHPMNVSVIAQLPNNQNSSIQQYNLQIAQELGAGTALNVAYVGTKADHLMTWEGDTSGHPYGTYLLAGAPALYPGQGLNPVVGAATGTSHYSGLQTSLNHRLTNGLQFTIAYTFSHATDDSNGAFAGTGGSGNGPILVDASGAGVLKYNFGNSSNDQRHAFTFASLYELPFGHGRMFGANMNRFADIVLGGWQINPFIQIGTGTPFDIIYNSGNVPGTYNGNRPNYNGSLVSIGSLARAADGNRIWLSAPAGTFVPAPVGTVPTLGRNHFYGPGYQTVDASIFKNFSITERVKMQFRAEGYNLLNTPQFVNPNVDASNGQFGEINATRQSSERELQFALRFTF